MAVMPQSSRVQELIRRLDEATDSSDLNAVCRSVKKVLTEELAAGADFLDDFYLRTAPDRYARRLLHRHPHGRYSAVVMVWDRGQGTPLHDHAGKWCVECVYRGRIKVTSFMIEGDPEAGRVQFAPESVIYAGRGEAGHLIPPFEHHTLENAEDSPAVTIHVYSDEMTWCHAFFPEENGWRRERRELSYTA
ncbi:MAG: cysteine dioxygenase family protein [Candidatus Eisenbacteria bacterium]|uniref:Cysteine dioxygenase family protein n=1 Tax=Eiseniibacteriota bacterium TaxID=2212470 RepID=A0A849SSN1_UNCEI|nr:cysteine dioxygenase family protein [Candidatus Eisenbacteria bacterium]